MRKPIPFISNSGDSRSVVQKGTIVENLYIEITEGGKYPAVLYRIPGISSAFTTAANPCRSNGVLFNGKFYFVAGGDVWEVDETEVPVSIGSVSTSSGRTLIVAGFDQIMILDGVNGYSYDGTTFAIISDVNFPPNQTPAITVSQGAYKDGFFLVIADGTGDVYKSALEDPTSWNGAELENAEAQPDNLVALHSTNDYLYLFGEYSTEAWYNAGLPNFPFKRAQGGVSSWGCRAPFSIAEGDNSIFFLGRTKEGGHEICKTSGATVQVISTPEISNLINNIKNDDAFAFIYMQEAHQFYVLTFPFAKKTVVYDLTNNTWTIRSSKDIGRWRPNGHVFYNNKHYVGDSANGDFYTLDMNTYTDNGDYIKYKVITPDYHSNYTAVVFNELVLDIQGGVGTDDVDPQVMMRYSDDGGRTWSSELWAGMGLSGDYSQKCFWDQLGESYQRRFEFSGTDSFFTALLGVYASMSGSEF